MMRMCQPLPTGLTGALTGAMICYTTMSMMLPLEAMAMFFLLRSFSMGGKCDKKVQTLIDKLSFENIQFDTGTNHSVQDYYKAIKESVNSV